MNTEAGVIIKDPEFYELVKNKIELKLAARNSWSIGPRRKIPILAFFNGIAENIFALIPFANIWPFTYSTSYELRDGGTEMSIYDEGFHENYKPVGQFPGTGIKGKRLKARLTKAFFGSAQTDYLKLSGPSTRTGVSARSYKAALLKCWVKRRTRGWRECRKNTTQYFLNGFLHVFLHLCCDSPNRPTMPNWLMFLGIVDIN